MAQHQKSERQYISSTAIYFLAVALAMTLFFQLWRGVLLVLTRSLAVHVPAAALVESFLVGSRFDFAVSCYVTLPLAVIGSIPFIDLSRSRIVRRINVALLLLFVALMFFVQLADIEFFRFFNYRLNGMALQWRDTPVFVVSMLWQTYPVVRYMILYLIVYALFVLVMRWLIRKIVLSRPCSPVVPHVLSLPILAAILILGARGRIEEKAPLAWGVAYFSEYDYANQLALNPNFTFFRDVVFDADGASRMKNMMRDIYDPQAQTRVMTLLGVNTDNLNAPARPLRRVQFQTQDTNPPNVILVIMESFGATRIGALAKRFPQDLSPRFDSLTKHGVLFTNFYSSGMHTYTGLFCSLYGMPAVSGSLVMKGVVGQRRYWGLPSILREHGYETLFFTTHDPHFDNMQGFLMANGVKRVLSVFDYDRSQRLSTLGVPDHVMFDRAVEELKNLKNARYFATLLTASNHGPWIIPDVPFARISGTGESAKELNAFKYSDWALGHFFERISRDPDFRNTVVIVTADNGALYEPSLDLDLTQFQAPLFVYDPRHPERTGKSSDRLGCQLDILSTVMGLVRLDYDDHSFGYDLLDSVSHGTDFAYFSEVTKIGYIEGSRYLIWRDAVPSSLYQLDHGRVTSVLTDPLALGDLKHKALAIAQTAYTSQGGVPSGSGPDARSENGGQAHAPAPLTGGQ